MISESDVKLEYALDLAEIPTFELLRTWELDRDSPSEEIHKKAGEQAREWVHNLSIQIDGHTARPTIASTKVVLADGAGNLPIIRVTTIARINRAGRHLEYEDENYPERAGWKEIVIESSPGVRIELASESSKDVSKTLTQYPADPTAAPPQDLKAVASWKLNATPTADGHRRIPPGNVEPVVSPIAQPSRAPAPTSPALMTRQAAPPGAVVRGDFLSGVLHQTQLTPWTLLIALGAAFLLGGAHALTPGHGKTIVAAYLVGARGTLKHAAFLGAMVTFTHTIAVFALGLATLFLFQYVVPEKITRSLGVVSGVCIVLLGAWMLRKRLAPSKSAASHAQTHHHPHPHTHHDHDHHHHHGHTHTHMPDEISWAGLVALGASGGLVPCESALILLLGAIALGRVGLGLLLLVAFSLGLAAVLMGIGILVLYAKRLIPERKRTANQGLLRSLSIASATAVMLVGLLMTGASLGLIQLRWAIG
ncbi:MAG: sulfite exporter TauE/SafE family protein [Acidobacteriaceae bacterium]|nr:sulfite exporter TauE/SafE family protein [Acidobacteriaceae bacterium]